MSDLHEITMHFVHADGREYHAVVELPAVSSASGLMMNSRILRISVDEFCNGINADVDTVFFGAGGEDE